MAQFDADNYIDVQERIVRFWQEHPGGAIRTRLMSPPDDFSQCRYEAAVYKQAGQDHGPDATGYAFELAAPGTRGPNATSHEENCETSAIGRALANMGYATTRQDRPSRQEMAKVARGTSPAANVAPGAPQGAQEASLRREAMERDLIEAIAQARTPNELLAAAKAIEDAGIKTDRLVAAYKARAEVLAPAPTGAST